MCSWPLASMHGASDSTGGNAPCIFAYDGVLAPFNIVLTLAGYRDFLSKLDTSLVLQAEGERGMRVRP